MLKITPNQNPEIPEEELLSFTDILQQGGVYTKGRNLHVNAAQAFEGVRFVVVPNEQGSNCLLVVGDEGALLVNADEFVEQHNSSFQKRNQRSRSAVDDSVDEFDMWVKHDQAITLTFVNTPAE